MEDSNSNNGNNNQISEDLLEILNSLSNTFISEIKSTSFEDLFMLIEEAYWYYIDIYLIQNPRLPKPDFINFAEMILKNNERLLPLHEALLTTSTYAEMNKKFEIFKRLIPRYGSIILNKDMTKIVLVKEQWWGWGFPKGKGKEGETETQSAAREVFEEIGFDITPHIRKDSFIQKEHRGVVKKFFLAVGVDENTDFETHTRYEISRIKWHNVEDLPLYHSRSSHQFAAIVPYTKQILSWIENKRKESGMEPILHKNQIQRGMEYEVDNDSAFHYRWSTGASANNNPVIKKFKDQQNNKVEDENEIILQNEIEEIYLHEYINDFKKFLKEKEKNQPKQSINKKDNSRGGNNQYQQSSSQNTTPRLNSNLRKMASLENIPTQFNLSQQDQQNQNHFQQQNQNYFQQLNFNQNNNNNNNNNNMNNNGMNGMNNINNMNSMNNMNNMNGMNGMNNMNNMDNMNSMNNMNNMNNPNNNNYFNFSESLNNINQYYQ